MGGIRHLRHLGAVATAALALLAVPSAVQDIAAPAPSAGWPSSAGGLAGERGGRGADRSRDDQFRGAVTRPGASGTGRSCAKQFPNAARKRKSQSYARPDDGRSVARDWLIFESWSNRGDQ